MSQETKTALCEWLSGLIIGLMPLCAHIVLHFFAKSDPAWDDNWTLDVLFIAISTSGLSSITVFSRLIKGTFSFARFTPVLGVVMAITIAFFFVGGLLYGAAASGKGNDWTGHAAYVLMFFSAVGSLYFEFALARLTNAPRL